MHSEDDLELLRQAYLEALINYEEISALLNRHTVTRTTPSMTELTREQELREVLEFARRRYFDAYRRS